jgi:hypothetical protein
MSPEAKCFALESLDGLIYMYLCYFLDVQLRGSVLSGDNIAWVESSLYNSAFCRQLRSGIKRSLVLSNSSGLITLRCKSVMPNSIQRGTI